MKARGKWRARLALILTTALAASSLAAEQTAYETQTKQWQAEREAELKADDGWLTLAGLFWLKEGDNRIGSDEKSEVVLPAAAAPARLGVIEFHDGKATLRVTGPAKVTLKDRAVRTVELQSDEKQKPDVLRLGGLSFFIIKRGARYGVRVKDLNSRTRREFTGRRWYTVDEAYRVTADFVAYDPPRDIDMLNKVGDVIKMKSPGAVVFKLNGDEYRMDALEEEGKLFFVFGDLTNGKATYGAGRFLYAEAPKDGKAVLDFNRAVNPPCVFTPFATCPLPPRQNRLKTAITAGELNYHSAHETAGQ